eukprot:g73568.t1
MKYKKLKADGNSWHTQSLAAWCCKNACAKYHLDIIIFEDRHRCYNLIAKKGCKSRPGGSDRIVLGDLALHEQNNAFYSVIFLASITHPNDGALLSIRQGTNKATHFADAILGAVHAGHLLAGDRLILDNARIHRAKKIIPELRVILSAVGIELAYGISAQILICSPEYNHTEFAFNWTKSNLKQNVTAESFLERIANAFAEEVTLKRMTNAYEHCMP